MSVKKVVKSEEEWRTELTSEQFEISRNKGTERAFSGEYNNCKDAGTYRCIGCGQELFSSQSKYDSGSGWPSFYEPISPEAIATTTDRAFFMTRVEVHCSRCDGHLGHVFEDGPAPTGLRYCMNSASLDLVDKGSIEDAAE